MPLEYREFNGVAYIFDSNFQALDTYSTVIYNNKAVLSWSKEQPHFPSANVNANRCILHLMNK